MIALIALLSSVEATSKTPPPPAPAEAAVTLPTPYTAEQIRESFQPGKQLMFGLKSPEGDKVQHWKVLASDEGTVTIEFRTQGEDAVEKTSTWEELRDHALFPEENTVREEGTRETKLGTFDCWIYTRTEGPKVSTFVFAKGLPGPPVVMTITVEGNEVFSMEQLKRSPNGNEARLLKR